MLRDRPESVENGDGPQYACNACLSPSECASVKYCIRGNEPARDAYFAGDPIPAAPAVAAKCLWPEDCKYPACVCRRDAAPSVAESATPPEPTVHLSQGEQQMLGRALFRSAKRIDTPAEPIAAIAPDALTDVESLREHREWAERVAKTCGWGEYLSRPPHAFIEDAVKAAMRAATGDARDARRYRAIRNDAVNVMSLFARTADDELMVGAESMLTGAELDAAIDAAIAQGKPTKEAP